LEVDSYARLRPASNFLLDVWLVAGQSQSRMKQFTQGIPEQSDEPQEAEEPDMPQNTTEPEDPEFHSYLETLVHIREFIELAAEMGDEAGVEMGKKGLWQLHGMVKDYFQDTCPGFPPPRLPSLLGDQTETGQARSGSFFSDPMLERESAEFRRLSQMLYEARLRNLMKDQEHIMLRLMQGIQEDASRIRDLERKSS